MGFALTSKGQITVPKNIREHLKLKAGDHADFFVDHHGTVFLLPERQISELKGIFKGRGKKVEVEEIDHAIADEVVSRNERNRKRL